jgi:hypothetical protein
MEDEALPAVEKTEPDEVAVEEIEHAAQIEGRSAEHAVAQKALPARL